MGVAWASGINLYAAILTLGVMSATDNIDLPPDLEILSNPLVIGAAGLMFFIEFFADKVPGVDSGWDTLQTFIRIPAGAILAAAIAGGALAGACHFTKAGTRLAINTSPEPFSNWTASILEDIAVIAGLWAALNHPIVFLILLGLFILLMIWLLPKIFRAIQAVYRKFRSMFSGAPPEPAAESGFSLSLNDDQTKD
jgi:hypothetical protein